MTRLNKPYEADIRREFFKYIFLKEKTDARYSRIWGNFNEGKRTLRGGFQAKLSGLRAGVPDVTIAIPAGRYPGGFIEIKRPGGKLSKDQYRVLKGLLHAGYWVLVADNVKDLIDGLEKYLRS